MTNTVLMSGKVTTVQHIALPKFVKNRNRLEVRGSDPLRTLILSDYLGAPATVKIGANKARTKHINVKYHRAKDFQTGGEIEYSYSIWTKI
jgi:hypothetical protein